MATRIGLQRSPLLFFSTLEEIIESDFTSTNEKMLSIVSRVFPNELTQPGQRINEYAECIVPNYSDGPFQSHFRFSRSSAKIFVGLFARCPEVPSQHLKGRPSVSVEKRLLLTMWVLGIPETIRSVSPLRKKHMKITCVSHVILMCSHVIHMWFHVIHMWFSSCTMWFTCDFPNLPCDSHVISIISHVIHMWFTCTHMWFP